MSDVPASLTRIHAALDADGINVDPYFGASIGGKPILPLTGADSVVSHLTYGVTQSAPNGVITYSFMHTPDLTGRYNAPKDQGTASHSDHSAFFPGQDASDGYYAFTPEQEAAARAAIQLWDDLIPQTFKETNGNGADIQFANSNDPGQAYTWPPYWNGHGATFQGDIFTHDPVTNPSNLQFGFGEYGRTTLIHEIGHSLGLSHPGNYDASDATGPTYEHDAEYFQDSQEYSIMSYFGAWNTGGAPLDWLHSGGALYDNSPQGPMLHDIVAIQSLYGADPTTRAGDTTYGFHSNAGNALYDFNQNPLPYYSLYDAGGGNDTIDLSGFHTSQYLNLNPGEFSSIGDVPLTNSEIGQMYRDTYVEYAGYDYFQHGFNATTLGSAVLRSVESGNATALASDTGVAGLGTVQYENFSIAYNTIIENAIGGQGRDLLVGNAADNRLDGQGGNDVLTGGAGKDVFVFENNHSTDTITDFQTGVDKIDLSSISGVGASNVSYNATTHQVQIDTDHNGIADLFINSAQVVNSGDYIFHA